MKITTKDDGTDNEAKTETIKDYSEDVIYFEKDGNKVPFPVRLVPLCGNLKAHCSSNFLEGRSGEISTTYSLEAIIIIRETLEKISFKGNEAGQNYLQEVIDSFETALKIFECINYFEIPIQELFFPIVRNPVFLNRLNVEINQDLFTDCISRQFFLDLYFHKNFLNRNYPEASNAIREFIRTLGWDNFSYCMRSNAFMWEALPLLTEILLDIKEETDNRENILSVLILLEINFSKLFEIPESSGLPALPLSNSPSEDQPDVSSSAKFSYIEGFYSKDASDFPLISKKQKTKEYEIKSTFYLPYLFSMFRTAQMINCPALCQKLFNILLTDPAEKKQLSFVTTIEMKKLELQGFFCVKHFKFKQSIIATLILQIVLKNIKDAERTELIDLWKQTILKIELSKFELEKSSEVLSDFDDRLNKILEEILLEKGRSCFRFQVCLLDAEVKKPLVELFPFSKEDLNEVLELLQKTELGLATLRVSASGINAAIQVALELKKINLHQSISFCLLFGLQSARILLSEIINLEETDEALNILNTLEEKNDRYVNLLCYEFYIGLASFCFLSNPSFAYEIFNKHIISHFAQFCHCPEEYQNEYVPIRPMMVQQFFLLILRNREREGIALILSHLETLLEHCDTPFMRQIEEKELRDYPSILNTCIAVLLIREDLRKVKELLEKYGKSEDRPANYACLSQLVHFLNSSHHYNENFLEELFIFITSDLEQFGSKKILSWLAKIFMKRNDQNKVSTLMELGAPEADIAYYRLLLSIKISNFQELDKDQFADVENRFLEEEANMIQGSESRKRKLRYKIQRIGGSLEKFTALEFNHATQYLTRPVYQKELLNGFIRKKERNFSFTELNVLMPFSACLCFAIKLSSFPREPDPIPASIASIDSDDKEKEAV